MIRPSPSSRTASSSPAIYGHLYGRKPTAAELDRDTRSLAGGLQRGSLVARYAEGSAKSRLAPQVNVAMVYLGMLGRSPDPSGWKYWVPVARRTSTDRIVLGFQRSSEYARRVG